jgi:uncharacterized protein (TIGR03435 family)
MRNLRVIAIGLIVFSFAADAQEFEVATVKVSAPGGGESGIRATPGRLIIENASLRNLIMIAYKVRPSLIEGGPSWADSTLFNVEGRASTQAGADPMFLMLQRLLEDRFQLRLHRETKDGSVYLLTVAKGGSRLKAATCAPFDANHLPALPVAGETPVNYCGRIRRGRGTLEAEGVGMVDGAGPPVQSLTGQLAEVLDRSIIDKTGLTGLYDIHLDWASDQTDVTAGPSIFTAMQEQLGLRLEGGRGPVEYMVVDRADKPVAN